MASWHLFFFFILLNCSQYGTAKVDCIKRRLTQVEEHTAVANLTLGLHVLVDGKQVLTTAENNDAGQDVQSKLQTIRRRLKCGGGGGSSTTPTCKTCQSGQYRAGCQRCLTCLTCSGGKYASGGCSGTSNRNCASCTSCSGGQVVVSACSSSSNTVCAAPTYTCSCANGYGTTGSSPSCSGCSSCYGFYQLSGGSCSACSKSCGGNQYWSSCNSCSTCRTCSGGQVSTGGCSGKSDRSCAAPTYTCSCANGYGTTGSSPSCSGCSSCYPSHYLAGSSCAARPTYTCSCMHGAGSTGYSNPCTGCSSCNGGYYLLSGSCRVCSSCPSGQVHSSGCAGSADRTCVVQSKFTCSCPHGVGKPDFCSSAATVDCQSCTGNYFRTGKSCTAWASECNGNSQYELENPTSTQNRVCAAKKCTCPGGTAAAGIACTNTEARCASCPAGTYEANGACLACSVGKTQPVAGLATECIACGLGQAALDALDACTACAIGKFQAEAVYTSYSCKFCPSGQSTRSAGLSACERSCAAGTKFQNYLNNGELNCQNCEPGQWTNGMATNPTTCDACPAGRYEDGEGSPECQKCPEGKEFVWMC